VHLPRFTDAQVLELIATGAPLTEAMAALCRYIDQETALTSAIHTCGAEGTEPVRIAGPHRPHPASGIATIVSAPILSKDGDTLGTLLGFDREPRRPTDHELALVRHATNLASLAMDREATAHTRPTVVSEPKEEALRRSEHLLRLVLDALPVGVSVLNPSGDIILSNPAAKRIWGEGLIRSGLERYATSKGWWHDTGKRIEPHEWGSARALHGETSLHELIDIETCDGVRKILRNSTVPIRDEYQHILGCVVINEDITARKAAERGLEASLDQMRTLSGRLMRAQDDERRRIARMLHETTAQDLAGLKMHLAHLHRTSDALSPGERAKLEESMMLADQSMSSIRTLSYLLHPPFLDEAGLASALRWYAGGFAERSGVQVELRLPPSFDRLPQDVETTLFRVVQEALINIHRHAQSEIAFVRLHQDTARLVLEIEDRGRGLSASMAARMTEQNVQQAGVGVGIAGMRERLQQLGGTLEIESSSQGTIVRALVPVEGRA
jgi:two-component system NarL family sensor kinase